MSQGWSWWVRGLSVLLAMGFVRFRPQSTKAMKWQIIVSFAFSAPGTEWDLLSWTPEARGSSWLRNGLESGSNAFLPFITFLKPKRGQNVLILLGSCFAATLGFGSPSYSCSTLQICCFPAQSIGLCFWPIQFGGLCLITDFGFISSRRNTLTENDHIYWRDAWNNASEQITARWSGQTPVAEQEKK